MKQQNRMPQKNVQPKKVGQKKRRGKILPGSYTGGRSRTKPDTWVSTSGFVPGRESKSKLGMGRPFKRVDPRKGSGGNGLTKVVTGKKGKPGGYYV